MPLQMRWMRARVITLSASEWFISGVHFHRNLHTLLSVLRSLAPGFHNFDFSRIFLFLFLLTVLQHLLRWFSAPNGIVLMRPRMLHNVLREMTSELFIWSKKLLCWLKRHTWAEILIFYWLLRNSALWIQACQILKLAYPKSSLFTVTITTGAPEPVWIGVIDLC